MNCHKELKHEYVVCNTRFKVKLNEVGQDVYELIATPCNNPTSVFCICRITKRENCCNNMNYFQSFINCDPVEIIQDCELDECICRSIRIYFNHMPNMNCRRNTIF